MSEEIRRELLSDLKELKRLEEENEQYDGQGINFPGGSVISYGSPQGYLRSNQVINYGNAPNFSYSQFLSPPQGRVVSNVSSYVTPQNSVGGLISSVRPLAQNYPAQQMLAYSQIPASQMNSSNVQISQNHVSGLKESIKGETYYEYVPFEKVYYEEEEKTVKELVNVKKNRTDYYAIEKKIEYIPYTKYETIQEQVPQERTEYITEKIVEYIPEVRTEMVPVERVEEKVEYKPVTRKIVHYPEFDQQYQEDAENSGNIRHSSGRLVGSQVISGGNNLVASQAFARPQQLAASQAFARPQSMVRSQTFARPQQMFSSQFFSGDGSYFGYPAYSGNLGVSNVRPANVGTYTSPLVSSNVVGGGLIRRSQAYSGNPGVYASQLGASNVSPIQNLAQSQIGTRPIPLSQSQVIGGASYGTNASWRIAGSGGNYTNQPYLNPSGFSGYRVNGNTLASKSQYLPQSGLPSAENGPHFIVNNIATGINMKKKKKI